MLESFILCIYSVFAAFGLLFFTFLVFKQTTKNTPVVISVYNSEDSVEYKIRELIKKNPEKEIIVVDLGSTDETQKIIKKLSVDFPYVHLILRNASCEKDEIIKKIKRENNLK